MDDDRAIRIDLVAPATTALEHAAGRLVMLGGPWWRDVNAGGPRLRGAGIDRTVVLLEPIELAELVPDGFERAIAVGLDITSFPIPDMGVPGDRIAFDRLLTDVARDVRDGRSVAVACLGGIGRTGTVTASLLADAGLDAEAAVVATRRVRPGAIETERQRQYVERRAAERTIAGDHVLLRRTSPWDLPALAAILAEPAVADRWGAWDRDRVERELVDDAETTWFTIRESGIIGAIALSEEKDPEYRHAGLDIFLTTARHGRGLGPDAIRAAARWLIHVGGHHRITIDPAADNEAAIRAYAKVGFRPVGRLRQYQRLHDTWEDGLLMELLADELA